MKLLFTGVVLVVVVAALGSYYCLRGQDGEGKLRIYYYPIGAETLTPVTSANIEGKGRLCEISSMRVIRSIRKVLDSATRPSPQKFTDLAVRVKVIEVNANGDRLLALVENDGLVRFATGEDGVISSKGMNTLKKSIEAQFM